MKILIVEDEPKVVAFLKTGLEEQGYTIDIAYDGQLGERKIVQNTYDLIILDIILPYINGHELCKIIRSKDQYTPIIMLSALGTTVDKVTGFDLGADDYLVKPFDFEELTARIKALIKRSSGIIQTSNTIKLGDLELNLDKKVAVRNGETVELTAKEFSLLELLMRNKGKVLSREEIAEKVWDITFDTGTNVVDVYINLLRKKIDRNHVKKTIHTKIGMGYYIDEQ